MPETDARAGVAGGKTGVLRFADGPALLRGMLVLAVCAWLTLAVVWPVFLLLGRSLYDHAGNFAGLRNFVHYFGTPALAASLYNSLFVSVATTLISGGLGLAYAFALTRTRMPAKGFFLGMAMTPLFSPTLLNGIALVYLFGKKGIVTGGFFGLLPGIDIDLYGPVGIVIAEVLYTFPQAVLILSVALRLADARLYEASACLGASRVKTFLTITIPGIRYGCISTLFVSFILAFTDFGAPKVIGGQYNVLATDIYKQVIGRHDFTMGAVVGSVLLIPTVLAFIADRLCRHKQCSAITSRSVPLTPDPNPLVDTLSTLFCGSIALFIAGFYLTALLASLVKAWPYQLTLGLWNYDFDRVAGGGYAALGNSIRMSLYSAAAGAAVTFGSAYLIEKTNGMRFVRHVAYLFCMLPLALPGMVIGLGYILFFNSPTLGFFGVGIPNPFNFLYGTMALPVLSNIVHFHTVSFLTATAALKQLDKEFETVSESLGVPFYRTFLRVTVPVCLPALLEIVIYTFVNSMATVSAVIFLYTPDVPLASVAVANMDDAGDTASAAAMSMLIVGISILARGGHKLLETAVERKTQAWIAH
ncbi:putative 2-aminoethylphosphonate ABC transporter permease subunit [Syntrophobacter fumaroxidans]|uniref:Binding-protein-dependent transport systems inner membrane component n=1 Tax=Syntrophobacter fumaroxidans (strain DSM 10017 / MPOB) TaxID=335543 RepID=A0LMC2_SYNFM|nr:putative 2-aminoethylphosphonate ABC transporter permease subunit [Syntrophobacter fumaroxidans]ABK18574.1 binding-protein-dependent transport systems inner membrane component [Syntrophobacter fumaroxidans MPOB]